MKRNKVLLYACSVALTAAIVLAAAVAPQLLFSAEDEQLFSETHPSPVTTGRLPAGTVQNAASSSGAPAADSTSLAGASEPYPPAAAESAPEEPLGDAAYDLPAVRMLYNYEEQQGNLETTYTSEQSQAELAELLPRSQDYILRLAEVGIIPYDLVEWLDANLYASSTINFTHGYDNRGYEYLTTNFGMGTEPPYYIFFIIDMNTDLILSCDMHIPPDAPHLVYDYNEPLNAYLAYLGLDALSSWQQVPYDMPEIDYAMLENQGTWAHPVFVGLYCDKVRVMATFQWRLYNESNSLMFGASSYRRNAYPF